jgi:hypothetical protein
MEINSPVTLAGLAPTKLLGSTDFLGLMSGLAIGIYDLENEPTLKLPQELLLKSLLRSRQKEPTYWLRSSGNWG